MAPETAFVYYNARSRTCRMDFPDEKGRDWAVLKANCDPVERILGVYTIDDAVAVCDTYAPNLVLKTMKPGEHDPGTLYGFFNILAPRRVRYVQE